MLDILVFEKAYKDDEKIEIQIRSGEGSLEYVYKENKLLVEKSAPT